VRILAAITPGYRFTIASGQSDPERKSVGNAA
jgi:hypothetical protein